MTINRKRKLRSEYEAKLPNTEIVKSRTRLREDKKASHLVNFKQLKNHILVLHIFATPKLRSPQVGCDVPSSKF